MRINKAIPAIAILCLAIVASLPLMPARAAAIKYEKSTVRADVTAVKADGIASAVITVKIVDEFTQGVKGQKVTLASSRGAQDEIISLYDTTDAFGEAKFRVKSLFAGSSVFTATVNEITLQMTVAVNFTSGLDAALVPGDLVKIQDDSDPLTQGDTAVYYYSKNGKRFVFPNEKTYFTWYADFTGVKTVSLDQMSQIPIGGNVTIRPGSKLVKFQTDPKTYAVSKGGVLRWLKTEAAAIKFYGARWSEQVYDIPEGFYSNYTFGDPIEESTIYVRDMAAYGSKTIDLDKGIQ